MLKSLGANTKTILWYNIQNKTYNSYVVNMKNNLEPLVVKKGGDNKNEQHIIYSNGRN